MEQRMKDRIKNQLIRHEGLRLRPWRDGRGRLTIGVARELEEQGISYQEAHELLEADIARCEAELMNEISEIYGSLNEARQIVLVNLCFILGIEGLLNYKQMLSFLAAGDWERAANGLLASRWAKFAGRRALELVEMLRKGE